MTNSVEQESESGNFGDNPLATGIPPPPPRPAEEQRNVVQQRNVAQENFGSPLVQLGPMDGRPAEDSTLPPPPPMHSAERRNSTA